MKLACEEVVPNLGCDFVVTGDTVGDVHGAMMAHGGEMHQNLMDGMSSEEMQKAGGEMDAHIRQLLDNR